ncbi:hypothetical protein BJ546DRAFT_952314 [Cryomyces antarcticus]
MRSNSSRRWFLEKRLQILQKLNDVAWALRMMPFGKELLRLTGEEIDDVERLITEKETIGKVKGKNSGQSVSQNGQSRDSGGKDKQRAKDAEDDRSPAKAHDRGKSATPEEPHNGMMSGGANPGATSTNRLDGPPLPHESPDRFTQIILTSPLSSGGGELAAFWSLLRIYDWEREKGGLDHLLANSSEGHKRASPRRRRKSRGSTLRGRHAPDAPNTQDPTETNATRDLAMNRTVGRRQARHPDPRDMSEAQRRKHMYLQQPVREPSLGSSEENSTFTPAAPEATPHVGQVDRQEQWQTQAVPPGPYPAPRRPRREQRRAEEIGSASATQVASQALQRNGSQAVAFNNAAAPPSPPVSVVSLGDEAGRHWREVETHEQAQAEQRRSRPPSFSSGGSAAMRGLRVGGRPSRNRMSVPLDHPTIQHWLEVEQHERAQAVDMQAHPPPYVVAGDTSGTPEGNPSTPAAVAPNALSRAAQEPQQEAVECEARERAEAARAGTQRPPPSQLAGRGNSVSGTNAPSVSAGVREGPAARATGAATTLQSSRAPSQMPVRRPNQAPPRSLNRVPRLPEATDTSDSEEEDEAESSENENGDSDSSTTAQVTYAPVAILRGQNGGR